MDFLAQIFGYVMKGCCWITQQSYVPALLLFALAMQLLLCPFGIKQQKNMVKQASLRPKEMAIRKKYAGRNDQVTMKKAQEEIMQLYQREGYSTVAGCLPMLFQLIIIFPIYNVVVRPLEFICGIGKDISDAMFTELALGEKLSSTAQIQVISTLKSDPSAFGRLSAASQEAINSVGGIEALPSVSLGSVDLGITPWDAIGQSGVWFLLLVPILKLGFMYLSQFLSRKLSYNGTQAEMANNSSMKIMLYVLPLMTMFITFQFAAAIGIYWMLKVQ